LTSATITIVTSDAALRDCYPAFRELRPHLTEDAFLAQVARQQAAHGYEVACRRAGGAVVAAAGYRVAEFLAWGRTFYLDDLVALPAARGAGHGGALLDWLIARAQALGCAEFHLDSGTHRHDAHRLYLSRKLRISSFHFDKGLGEP
jgi:GNAT superfamily N-acetyltransferase